METKTQSAPATQGAAAEPTDISVNTITEYLKKDLSIAISCLNAIQSDPDLINHLAQFMHGRFINAKHAEENQKAKG